MKFRIPHKERTIVVKGFGNDVTAKHLLKKAKKFGAVDKVLPELLFGHHITFSLRWIWSIRRLAILLLPLLQRISVL